jgi:hypothetical protein
MRVRARARARVLTFILTRIFKSSYTSHRKRKILILATTYIYRNRNMYYGFYQVK